MKTSFDWPKCIGFLTLAIVAFCAPCSAWAAIATEVQYNFGDTSGDTPIVTADPSLNDPISFGGTFFADDKNGNDITQFGGGPTPPALYMTYANMVNVSNAFGFGSAIPSSTAFFQFSVDTKGAYDLTLTNLSADLIRVGLNPPSTNQRDILVGIYESSTPNNPSSWTFLEQVPINSQGKVTLGLGLSSSSLNEQLGLPRDRTFRFYLVDHGSGTGFNAISPVGFFLDNVELDGSAVPTPELPSFAIWGLGALGLAIGVRFRRIAI